MSQHGKGIAALKWGKAAGRGKNGACKENSNRLNGALGSRRTAHINILFTDFVLLETPPHSQGRFSSAWLGLQLIDLANNRQKGNSSRSQLLACTWLSFQQRDMVISGKHTEWDLKGWCCTFKSLWLQQPVGTERSLVPAVLGEKSGRWGMRDLSWLAMGSKGACCVWKTQT